MAQNKTGTQGTGGKPGGQNPSKGKSQQHGTGASRKPALKEEENDNSSFGKSKINK